MLKFKDTELAKRWQILGKVQKPFKRIDIGGISDYEYLYEDDLDQWQGILPYCENEESDWRYFLVYWQEAKTNDEPRNKQYSGYEVVRRDKANTPYHTDIFRSRALHVKFSL